MDTIFADLVEVGPRYWITATAVLAVSAALSAGPRLPAAGRTAIGAGLWIICWLAASVAFGSLWKRDPLQALALGLAMLPTFGVATAATVWAASRGASTGLRIPTFIATGALGAMVFPSLLLLLTCMVAHDCL